MRARVGGHTGGIRWRRGPRRGFRWSTGGRTAAGSRGTLQQCVQQLAADVLGVRGRDRLLGRSLPHPVDAHGDRHFAARWDVPWRRTSTGPCTVPKRFSTSPRWSVGSHSSNGCQDVSNQRSTLTAQPEHAAAQLVVRRIGAPGTFSITHGNSDACSRSRVAGSSQPCRGALEFQVGERMWSWHGGLAWMASNPSSGQVIASAWWNSNGYRGWGLMSTPIDVEPGSVGCDAFFFFFFFFFFFLWFLRSLVLLGCTHGQSRRPVGARGNRGLLPLPPLLRGARGTK